MEISPLGKTPVLSHKNRAIFESVAILEYLEDISPHPLHPSDPITRAQHRGWIEFGSAILNDIAGFYSAPDDETFNTKITALTAKFTQLEKYLGEGPYFEGQEFTLVDAVFGPIFRYFDTFDVISDFGVLTGNEKLETWRQSLNARASIKDAVSDDYPSLLREFLLERKSYLSNFIAQQTW